MKIKLIAALLAVLALIFLPDWGDKYPVGTSYEFPSTEGLEREEAQKALEIPQTEIEKMSTAALLETYLNYPLKMDMLLRNTYSSGFGLLQGRGIGLDELMERDDLCSAVYSRYIQLYPTVMRKVEEGSHIYDDATEDFMRLTCLEVLAAHMDLDFTDREDARLIREIERKDALYKESDTNFRGMSAYFWTLKDLEYKSILRQ